MDKGYIKQSRITTLWRFYLNNNGDYDLTLNRALQMGVSKQTAISYMDNILARVDKINSNNK